MATGSGLFTIPEFLKRNVLKLAPDAFVAINGNVGMKVVAPTDLTGVSNLDTRGGITSINITGTVHPPGSNRCTLEIIAPVYKGLHEDYYTTLPNGVKSLIITPMMEIKVFMKGRFLQDGNPKYYPVFWGLITEVNEDYSGGVFRFTVTCGDYLTWWKYQKLILNPSSLSSAFGAPPPAKYPTVLLNMSPWQIIYNLCANTQFVDSSGRNYNFVFPDFSKSGFPPDFGKLTTTQVGAAYNSIAKELIAYWNKRFGQGISSPQSPDSRVPLEMYGLVGPIALNKLTLDLFSYSSELNNYKQSDINAQLDINFNLLARIQPYGALNLYGDGGETLEYSKLDIATQICEQTQMEFFVDMSGSLVFKPPFYNLDVFRGGYPYYVVEPSDITTFNSSFNSDNICTYLEAVAPKRYDLPELDSIGYHIDYDLMKTYGLRYQKLNIRYGNDARTVRLLAAAEMARINGRAFTGSVSMPLRPEMRLGYPVYLPHIDAYYYVSGISHSVTIGSSSTTTLSLEYRRDRVFSPGGTYNQVKPDTEGTTFDAEITVPAGGVLNGYVYRFRPQDISQTAPNIKTADQAVQQATDLTNKPATVNNQASEQDVAKNELQKKQNLADAGVISGPAFNGFYVISKAENTPIEIVSKRQDQTDAIASNELIMITDETYPYTDLYGYKHIGAFPYGANLLLSSDGVTFSDACNPSDKADQQAMTQVNAAPNTQGAPGNSAGTVSTSSPGQETSFFDVTVGGKVPENLTNPLPENTNYVELSKDPKLQPQPSEVTNPSTDLNNQTNALIGASVSGSNSSVSGNSSSPFYLGVSNLP